jgi:hypothetical protein
MLKQGWHACWHPGVLPDRTFPFISTRVLAGLSHGQRWQLLGSSSFDTLENALETQIVALERYGMLRD